MAEPVLKKGSNEPAVRDLQEALGALGHYHGPIDGAFGDATEAAVKAFQQAREIPADGIVGKVTWINIDEADQSLPAECRDNEAAGPQLAGERSLRHRAYER